MKIRPQFLLLIGLLTSCATYQPLPLDDTIPQLPDMVRQWQVPDGVNLVQIATLAVSNNPDLKAQRARFGVANAQLIATGILPDPQLSIGLDKPGPAGPGLVTGVALGLSYDLAALVSRSPAIDAAHQEAQMARLGLLWQEWQVVQQARSLAVRLRYQTDSLSLLEATEAHYEGRFNQSEKALVEGNTTLDVNGADLTALVDVQSQISRVRDTRNQTGSALNLILGLPADTQLDIAALPPPTPLAVDEIGSMLTQLATNRPDLLALKAGYASQEARVRGAILAQFPTLGVSLNRASDTSNVATTGLGLTIGLPLWNRNRGAIGIERATRAQLRLEYAARLAQARSDIDRLIKSDAILASQQAHLTTYLPKLSRLVDQATAAFRSGEINALTYLNMESTLTGRKLELLDVMMMRHEGQIALEAMLALPAMETTVQ